MEGRSVGSAWQQAPLPPEPEDISKGLVFVIKQLFSTKEEKQPLALCGVMACRVQSMRVVFRTKAVGKCDAPWARCQKHTGFVTHWTKNQLLVVAHPENLLLLKYSLPPHE